MFQASKIENFVNRIESYDFSKIQLVISFLVFVFIRCFLEIFSSNADFTFIQYYHYILFFIALALTFVVILRFFTKEDINKLFNIVLTGFFIIVLPPIIDLVICGRGKCIMTYLLPRAEYMDNLLYRFFSLGGEITSIGGITPGIKIGLTVIFIFSSLYVFIKSKNFLKSFVYFIVIYCIVFLYMTTPIFLKYLFYYLGTNFYYNDIYFVNIYFVIITLLAFIILFFDNSNKLVALSTKDNVFRGLYYIFLFFLGMSLSKNIIDNFYNENFVSRKNGLVFLTVISVVIMLLLSALIIFCIHKICYLRENKNDFYSELLFVSVALIFVGSVAVGFNIFYMVLLFIGSFFLYFSSPFLLRNNFVLSKIVIGIGSLIVVLIGYVVRHVHQENINWNALLNSFPTSLIFYSVVIGLASSFIDVKCYNNDKRNNIKTLPTLLGAENGKIVIGLFLFAAYLLMPFFLKMSIVSILIIYIISIVQFFLVNREKYSENHVLGLIVFSLLLIILDYLFFL